MNADSWNTDPNFWEALDKLVEASWLPLKELLDVVFEHKDTIGREPQAFLFGVIGNFVRVYYEMRAMTNPPQVSFNEGMQTVFSDRRVQELFQLGMQSAVDNKVSQMRGE